MIKIAIAYRKGSFSEKWIEYCRCNNIPYKIVNPYDSNIVVQVKDCSAFMWHYSHYDYKDVLFAKQLLYSLEQIGIKVFPNFNTTWHFDDKVGQKYLLESIDAPLVPSYVFYTKKEALKWIEQTSFPKVFKLRGGAGASNVMLVHSKNEAIKFTKQAFSQGFSQFNRIGYLKDRIRKFKDGKDSFIGVLKGICRLFILPEFAKMHSREKGYVYFQDFIPNNQFDIRLVIINGKAIAEKRMCRKGDFRASGSGQFVYEKVDEDVLEIGFSVAERLGLQSVAFDFIFDEQHKPLIVEMSYAFGTHGISHVPGYWDRNLDWHKSKNIDFYSWMVEQIL